MLYVYYAKYLQNNTIIYYMNDRCLFDYYFIFMDVNITRSYRARHQTPASPQSCGSQKQQTLYNRRNRHFGAVRKGF